MKVRDAAPYRRLGGTNLATQGAVAALRFVRDFRGGPPPTANASTAWDHRCERWTSIDARSRGQAATMESVASEMPRRGRLHVVEAPTEFWVWLDPASFLVRHHVEILGQIPALTVEPSPDRLMFVRNPDFRGSVSPFALGITAAYNAEVMLEHVRLTRFRRFASRLDALFLVRDRTTALSYRDIHPEHVANRVLKRVVARTGSWSAHDASWVDFLRLPHSLDQPTIDHCVDGYWSGASPVALMSMGKPWTPNSVEEILYFGGMVDVLDRDLGSTDE